MNQQDRFEYQGIDTTLTAVLVVGFAVVGAVSAVVCVIHALIA